MEELYLQPPEEAPAPRAAGAASLPRHRSDQAVLIAYPYPSRPAAMAAAVRVDLGMVSLAEPLARAERRRVGHLGVGRGRYRPARRHAVEAVHDGRQVRLAGGDAELGRVGYPELVRLVRAEAVPAPVVAQEVGRRLRDLALVGAVAPLLPGGAGERALVPHDAADRPLAYRRAVPRIGVDLGVHAPVAVCAAAGPGRLDHGLAGGRVPLGLVLGLGASRVLAAALGRARHGQDLAEPVFSPQRLHHRRLLLVRRQLRVGAPVFFYHLEGRLARVEPELHPPEPHLRLSQHVPQDLDAVWQAVVFPAHGDALLSGVPAIIAHHLPSPDVGRRPRHAVLLGDLRSGSAAGPGLGHRPYLLRERDRTRFRARPPVFPLPGGELVDPAAEALPAGGIAHPAHGPGEALSVREVVVHGGPPHLKGELGLPPPLRGPDLPMLQIVLVPGPERMPRRVPQLRNSACMAMIESDEGLDRDPSLFGAEHAASFLSRFGSGSPPQSQWSILD